MPDPMTAPTMGDVIAARFGRRDLIKGLLATTAISAVAGSFLESSARAADAPALSFQEIAHGSDGTHHVAPGYDADILIRWGDPVLADAPPFDPLRQTAEGQAKQFGYNNDYLGYVPLPEGSGNAEHGLLCINHEYTNPALMFPDLAGGMTKTHVDIEMAAHGGSVIEIQKTAGKWRVVQGSRYARRITAETPISIGGPAAGHPRMRTGYDPSGTAVRGMINNCAGGITPWGTYLSGEENFNNYFAGTIAGHAEEANYRSYGIPGEGGRWARFHDRFDIGKEPNEANRFGWIVETDTLNPAAPPVKRTALGRFKHEGAETVVNGDGRLVVYSGDDERFAHVYRFVTAGRYNPADRAANRDLLDSGTLSVARYNADGTLDWLPLVHGEGPLTQANGFQSQADVLIEARKAARLLGATPMDRPEDVEPSKLTGKIYVVLTNNDRRKPDQRDAANPRAENQWGHIIEMAAPGRDHAAAKFTWEILLQAGNPADPATGAQWNAATSTNGWFACPDNVALDGLGRLWVATDQGNAWKKTSGSADGAYAMEVDGPRRGASKMFFRAPIGAEVCGPLFTPDSKTFFCAVQHPGADGVEQRPSFANPATRWPDFRPDLPVRPAVVAITKQDGGVIGG